MSINFLSSKAKSIKGSPIFEFSAKAKALKNNNIKVYDFTLGEPDLFVPEYVKNGAIEAIKNNKSKYTPVAGTNELKNAIIKKFEHDNQISYTLEEVISGNGAKQILFNALFSVLDNNDEVIIFSPFWSSYQENITLCGGIPVIVETLEENNFKPTREQIAKVITNKTKAIMINSPGNPSGNVYSKEELMMIGSFMKEYPNFIIISDEIYEYLIYDNKKHYSLANLIPEFKDRILTVNGCSKSFAMTGWRIGFAGGNKELIKSMNAIQSQVTSNPCSISQEAAIVALNGDKDFLKEYLKEYKSRRDYIYEKVNKINNLSMKLPEGAFYAFVNISKCLNKKFKNTTISNSVDFCNTILVEYHVAIIPGEYFSANNFVRISYASSMEDIKELCIRLQDFCSKLD